MHFIVLIYGFTAILGKLINMEAIHLVWYRMLFAIIGLIFYIKIKNTSLRISNTQILKLISIGLIVAAHWITFFHAIKISNISVTLGILSSGTLFASILEPIIFKKPIKLLEMLIGIAIICGLYLIFRFELNYADGIIVALISTLLATTFTILNKSFTYKLPPSTISFYEMTGGFIGLTIYLFATNQINESIIHPSSMDLLYTAILGIICTAFAFAVSIDVMKELSAYTVILSINMEPVYGIILAYMIFGESELMTGGFYVGTIVILTSVFMYPVFKRRQNKISSLT